MIDYEPDRYIASEQHRTDCVGPRERSDSRTVPAVHDSVADAVAYMRLVAATYGWYVQEHPSRSIKTREFTLNHTGRIIAVRVTALRGQRNDGHFASFLLIRPHNRGSYQHFESKLWKETNKQRELKHLLPFRKSRRLMIAGQK